MNEYVQQNLPVFVTAAVVLLALILLLVVWRTISPRMSGKRGQRLGISEYHELDKMRRLVLVRRDNTEHLILIGGPQDVVIETGIGTGIPSQSSFQAAQAEELPSLPIRPAPRPPVFGDRTPPPLRSSNPSRPRDEEP